MKRLSFVSLAFFLLLFEFGSAAAPSPVVISEFMASNSRVLADDFGQFSDWIEIRNASGATVGLENWALTTHASHAPAWHFPATNLAAGSSLVIFASGRNRAIPGVTLHTDFKLNVDGEYLALLDPAGHVATEFAPAYPAQVQNGSFGFGLLSTNISVMSNGSPVRIRVPSSGADGTNWTFAGYDDSSWTAGVNGVGFGGISPNPAQSGYALAVAAGSPVAYWRLNESNGTVAANAGSQGTAGNGIYFSATAGQAGPRPAALLGFEVDNRAAGFNGTSGYIGASPGLLDNRSAFTLSGWIKTAIVPASRAGLFGQNGCVSLGFITGTTLQLRTAAGGSLDVNLSLLPSNSWHHVVGVGDGTGLQIYVDGGLVASGGTPTSSYGASGSSFKIGGGGIFDPAGNFFNGFIDEVAVYHRGLTSGEVLALYQAGTNSTSFSVAPYIATDLGASLSNVNASVYLRFPFVLPDPTNLSLLTLRLRYNDGYVAWINGVEVGRANAPEALAYDSAATAAHSASLLDELRLGVEEGPLRAGTNILAIQGLNVSAFDPDFLILAEVAWTTLPVESGMPGYFAVPTPGQPNIGGSTTLGPIISDVRHTPNVPLNSEDVIVTARISTAFNQVTNVSLQYRIMFTPDLTVQMFDDGAHGDGGAGDGVFGAVIPSSASTNGQMIRYIVRARDAGGNASRIPVFSSAVDTAEYLGTIVNPTNVTSKLPIIHFFVNATQQSAVDAQGGGRASVFYDGEFYDNVLMAVRGNTTVNYIKKSHRVEFNREHPFRHLDSFSRIRKTSFEADYVDPTYMRQGLAFWLCDLLGCPSPFYYPVRLQLNADFYQLANHNDVHGEELLTRLGYDPNGALYNAAGTAEPSRFSTGGFEKKTRKFEGVADYIALAGAIAETVPAATREVNVFDLFDIPTTMNYLVAARWSHENDDVWANMSLYHDNDGDDLWRIIPFDMNLSWGAIYYEGGTPLVIEGVQATNDIHKAHPLYGSSTALALSGPGAPDNFNRVYDAFFEIPQLREMFLRRTRTMLDKVILPPGSHPLSLIVEKKILDWRELILDEANRDRAKWQWPTKGGQASFDPGISPGGGVAALLNDFVAKRRSHFYNKHSITNATTAFPVGVTKTNNAGIPLSQPLDATVNIAGVEYNPASGNQAQEFVCLTNAHAYAIDLSGWKLGGGIGFTFALGTVIPSHRALYVSPDVKAFRARTTGPRGGQGLFVVGPFHGRLSARGETLFILDDQGRGVTTNSYGGTPSPAQQFLRITEIMYNPRPLIGTTNDAQAFEYVELKNISTSVTLDLNGVRFFNGVAFNFTGSAITSLAPGQRVLVVKDAAAFAARYGAGRPVAGAYSGKLENKGERVTLVDAFGEEILDFSYHNTWYPVTDGAGFSLVIMDEKAEPDLWNSKSNWRPSGVVDGAPGQPDTAPPVVAPIVINEVLANSDAPATDAIELFNPTAAPVNVGGWFLTDDFGTPRKFRIPDNTSIPAGGYVTFDEGHFNTPTNAPASFALSSKGDEVYLFSGNGTDLTGYVQGFAFGASAAGVTFGRYVNSRTNVDFVAQRTATFGGPNAGPKVGPIVISEIMYHPPDLPGARDDSLSEYVELQNISEASVPLHNGANPLSTWRLSGGVDLSFPGRMTLAPGAFLLAVNFDPTAPNNAAQVASFRARYSVPAGVTLLGPYRGKLNNDSDQVRLERPDAPVGGEVPYVLVDRVDYEDGGAWPAGADGAGAALQRIDVTQYGNDPINWRASAPTAGAGSGGGTAPSIASQPSDQTGLASLSATLRVVAGGTGPLRYQWRFNGANVDQATNSTLVLNDLLLEQAGTYAVVVYNSAGAIASAPARLTVILPAYFQVQPAAVTLRGSTNLTDYGFTTNSASFSALASGVGPIHYQWRFNGTNINGATASSLTVANVGVTNDGSYDVVVTDDLGSVASAPARLKVLVTPMIVQSPTPQIVLTNGFFTASVVIRGNPPPFRYDWREVSTVRSSITNFEVTNFFTYGPLTTGPFTNKTTQWRLVIFNDAAPAQGILAAFNVVSALDSDGDGMPDLFESLYHLDPFNGGDRDLDSDDDGLSNYQEFLAGTDPADGASNLRLRQQIAGNGAVLTFQAQSNRTYSVQFTENFARHLWAKLSDIPGATISRLITIVDPHFHTNRFYRVVTPQRP